MTASVQQVIAWLREAQEQNIPVAKAVFHQKGKFCPAGWCAYKAGVSLDIHEINNYHKVDAAIGGIKYTCHLKAVAFRQPFICGQIYDTFSTMFTHLSQDPITHQGHGMNFGEIADLLESLTK